MADDIDKLIRWACSQGWEVRTDSKGYRHFHSPDGEYRATYPATPSNPRRRYRDVRVRLTSFGLPWPPPSKSEQRSQRRKEGQT